MSRMPRIDLNTVIAVLALACLAGLACAAIFGVEGHFFGHGLRSAEHAFAATSLACGVALILRALI